ncbi:Eukaryotic elongation factor 2 kinase [Trema orientale]|uniref:Eukaryotic elongation factor 2 kinase n=1 Tax=Trema orientale TaxID=63057 RepID=A0A2P5ECH7_TREOI|nr:Eukaryotic elongation factor 2 kinase [Trema orientale]
MGKSLPSTTRLQELTKVVSSSEKLQKSKLTKPISRIRIPSPEPVRSEQDKSRRMESSEGQTQPQPQPLSLVVADCAKRWFRDTLKEAKAGDTAMQVLVGQMYFNGYGVAKDPQKARVWLGRASKSRASAWNVGDKRPGYHASDSDSDEPEDDPK